LGRSVISDKFTLFFPEKEIPNMMCVNGINVTGWVYSAVMEPPHTVRLYVSHNGTTIIRELEERRISTSRACRELGIFYKKDA
jgi:hypothetical protein